MFIGINVNVSGLECFQPVGRQRLGKKLAALWIATAVSWLPLGSADRVYDLA